MSLLPIPTQLENDQSLYAKVVADGAELLNATAAVIAEGNRKIASLPGDRLAALLNADVALSVARLTNARTIAAAINAALDAVGSPAYTNRIPLDFGNPEVAFDSATNQFVYTPAPAVLPPAPPESPAPAPSA